MYFLGVIAFYLNGPLDWYKLTKYTSHTPSTYKFTFPCKFVVVSFKWVRYKCMSQDMNNSSETFNYRIQFKFFFSSSQIPSTLKIQSFLNVATVLKLNYPIKTFLSVQDVKSSYLPIKFQFLTRAKKTQLGLFIGQSNLSSNNLSGRRRCIFSIRWM